MDRFFGVTRRRDPSARTKYCCRVRDIRRLADGWEHVVHFALAKRRVG